MADGSKMNRNPERAHVRRVVSGFLDDEHMRACTDGSCIFGPPGGMQTNGGCQCIKEAACHGPVMLAQVRALAGVIRAMATRISSDALLHEQSSFAVSHEDQA